MPKPRGRRGPDRSSTPLATRVSQTEVDGATISTDHERDRSRVIGIVAAPGGSLLLLRAFLGVTFSFAGLQKLSNANFFRSNAPGSFDAQLRGAILTSPLHHLLDPALHVPGLIAVVVSFGELAVGLGTLLGLLSRVAAVGGMLLSLMFFLTVSFRDSPYYYGADIVFLFAWTPLALGGAGSLSLDAFHFHRLAHARAALELAGTRNSSLVRRRALELERRVFLQRITGVGVLAAVGVALGGGTAGLGRLLSSSTRAAGVGGFATTTAPPGATTTPKTSSGSPRNSPRGTPIGLASVVPVGGAATFTDPSEGVPAFVVQPKKGTFLAFSAVCPHAGCQVEFFAQDHAFVCPCHGSIFSANTGAVIQGPAVSGLPSIRVALGPGGELYVDG